MITGIETLSAIHPAQMLASHRRYLDTEYHEGHRANFASADPNADEYKALMGLSGEPSTAMSAIGSTKRHTAHARGSSPRRAISGPKMRSLGSKKDWAGGRNGRQCAAVMPRRSPAPSTTKPRPLPAVT